MLENILNNFLVNEKISKFSGTDLFNLCKDFLLSENLNIDNEEKEIWWILQHYCDKDFWQKDDLYLSQQQQNKIMNALFQRSVLEKPLAYILENVPFTDLTISCKPPVLIPRPETEDWVINLLTRLKKDNNDEINILDLCTGTGCIALTLGKNLNSSVIGIDIDLTAISLAKKNKFLNKVNNCEFLLGDLFAPLKENKKFNLITSNPPYISAEDFFNLPKSVVNWESPTALLATNNGLFFYEIIIKNAQKFLQTPNTSSIELALEIDHNKVNDVLEILEKNNFIGEIQIDQFGKNRAIFAKRKSI